MHVRQLAEADAARYPPPSLRVALPWFIPDMNTGAALGVLLTYAHLA